MIADDHSMIREGLKQLLELEGDIIIESGANDGCECLDLLRKKLPDILLLDINMPVMNGLEVLKIIKDEKIDVKVIVLTFHNEIEYLIKAMDFETDGYILKDSDSTELRRAIFNVYNGHTYIQPSLIPLLNKKMIEKDNDQVKLEKLTNLEIEILKYLAVGEFNKDIAKKLEISERTVKNHISNIFHKLEVSDRTQAAVFAIRTRLIRI